MPPWTISPIPLESDLAKGDLVQVTLEGGRTRTGMVSDISQTPEGGVLTLTLWTDPGPEAGDI